MKEIKELHEAYDKEWADLQLSLPDSSIIHTREHAKLKDKFYGQIQALFDKRVEGEGKHKDTWWHDNIQRVKALIKEGKNPQTERDNNLAHDHWHPELALLWEIAIEALKSKIKEGGDGG